MDQQRTVPVSRLSRLLHLGRLGSGIASGAIGEGFRQLSTGNRPRAVDLLLTPENARRLAERLSEMRGAAMKLGQLLSMEAGDLLPPPLPDILARLRESAHTMPLGQVAQVLDAAWGPGWEDKFQRFSFAPLAAASIGQVHEAQTKDGRHLAIKIQYPGIARSIDSDLDNVATLLRVFRLLPSGLKLDPLLTEAKRQLHQEADYLFEAEQMRAYRSVLGTQEGLRVPEVVEDLTTRTVLAMELMEGAPIESLASAPRETRNRIATRLVELALRELFAWGLVQTDPNFANFRYRLQGDEIVLLDFGAARRFAPERVDAFRSLIAASFDEDKSAVESAAMAVGYLSPADPAAVRRAIVQMVYIATEPARQPGVFDFAQADLSERLSEQVLSMRIEQGFGRLPPPDILYLHRKLGGLYLLCKRLSAQVAVTKLIAPYLAGKHAKEPLNHLASPSEEGAER
jgi:predicted unusual protein kinase regulating ubiquinone biosynthesis (AarF/ABC1/UbiB family)